MADEENSIPSYTGHRGRLKKRFMETGGIGFQDYELIELLLCYAIPQKDVKPLAKTLIQHFGSFADVIHASPTALSEISGIKDNTITLMKLFQVSCERMLSEEIQEKTVLDSWSVLENYCRLKMGHLKHEEFHVLFLDNKNHLIKQEMHQKGTVNQAPVFPREVVKRCLELGAVNIILAHNHPSGDLTPSRSDIDVTGRIIDAARLIGVTVHDHVIVSRRAVVSFRSLGLI